MKQGLLTRGWPCYNLVRIKGATGYMYLSIDVGGTKTLLTLFDKSGKLTDSEKFPTPKVYSEFSQQLKETVSKFIEGKEIKACAIAMPGVLDRKSGVAKHFGNLDWTDVPVVNDLSTVVSAPIYLENDAKLAALAAADQVKDLYKRVLYITVSTGIGLGLVVDGKLDYSVHDAGGRGMMFEHGGKIMAWEEFASGKAIVAKFGKRASDITDPEDWYIIARNLAVGLIDLTISLSPEVIVFGGGVGAHLPKYQQQLHTEMEIYMTKMIDQLPQMLQAEHPEEAVAYGGYLLCQQA